MISVTGRNRGWVEENGDENGGVGLICNPTARIQTLTWQTSIVAWISSDAMSYPMNHWLNVLRHN